MLNRVVRVVRLLELRDRLHACHCPVRQLPRFRPADVLVLRAQDDHCDFKVFVPNTGAQAGTCVGSDACLDSVDASLAQHQVGVVPLVRFSVSIGVFLHLVKLSADNVSEALELHALGRQFGNIQGRRFVLHVRKSVRTVIRRVLQPKTLCRFIHLFQKEQHLWVVSELGKLHHEW